MKKFYLSTNTMVPVIARNTIIFTGTLALYAWYDFFKLLNSYKKNGGNK